MDILARIKWRQTKCLIAIFGLLSLLSPAALAELQIFNNSSHNLVVSSCDQCADGWSTSIPTGTTIHVGSTMPASGQARVVVINLKTGPDDKQFINYAIGNIAWNTQNNYPTYCEYISQPPSISTIFNVTVSPLAGTPEQCQGGFLGRVAPSDKQLPDLWKVTLTDSGQLASTKHKS